MATAGPNLPTVGTTDATAGLAPWANAGNIVSHGDGSAVAASIPLGISTVLLVAKGFGFAVPLTATITGIQVRIVRSSTAGRCRDERVQLLVGGAAIGDNKAIGQPWPASLTPQVYGGPADTWGLMLTPENINGPHFGVAVQVAKDAAGPGGAAVDVIEITVHYTA